LLNGLGFGLPAGGNQRGTHTDPTGLAVIRLAGMHAILRAKFDQYPALADILVDTGDARIDYSIASPYWSDGKHGRNWLGRLLELVRSEILARRAGFLP
jgi:predicted NAD-dependent protein-ADP-ribosyltransferase YbiA (DUF1768 family)